MSGQETDKTTIEQKEVPPIKIKATQNKTISQSSARSVENTKCLRASPEPSLQSEITEKQIQQKPKRKCTEKQLAALAAGRLKNPHYLAKLEREKLEREKQQK